MSFTLRNISKRNKTGVAANEAVTVKDRHIMTKMNLALGISAIALMISSTNAFAQYTNTLTASPTDTYTAVVTDSNGNIHGIDYTPGNVNTTTGTINDPACSVSGNTCSWMSQKQITAAGASYTPSLMPTTYSDTTIKISNAVTGNSVTADVNSATYSSTNGNKSTFSASGIIVSDGNNNSTSVTSTAVTSRTVNATNVNTTNVTATGSVTANSMSASTGSFANLSTFDSHGTYYANVGDSLSGINQHLSGLDASVASISGRVSSLETKYTNLLHTVAAYGAIPSISLEAGKHFAVAVGGAFDNSANGGGVSLGFNFPNTNITVSGGVGVSDSQVAGKVQAQYQW